jgi:hypothetical protein
VVAVSRHKEKYLPLRSSIGSARQLLRNYRLPALCLFILLFFYWMRPPTNPDSLGYHYLSILWYEKYKIVPGLANLHGRYAFNPASFIIQSAYSFSDVAGQAIYPLNGVITSLFLFWMLVRVIRHRNSLTGLVYFITLIIFSRLLLGNMSSPASDPLMQICLAYSIIRCFELIQSKAVTVPNLINLSLILLYAPIAKLSAYPAFFILAFTFLLLPRTEKKGRLFTSIFVMTLLLYIPWIARNFIMSGYLAYPFPHLDFFHPDWKVPGNVMMDYYDHIKYGPKIQLTGVADPAYLNTLHFSAWFFPWLSILLKNKEFIELSLFLAAILSPLLWMIVFAGGEKRRDDRVFTFWVLIYASVWLWLIGSPDFRFGTVMLSMAFIVPMTILAAGKGLPWTKTIVKPFSTVFVIFTLYYLYGAYAGFETYAKKKDDFFTWKNGLVLPLKDIKYSSLDSKSGFPYKMLHSTVKLYLGDSTHACINADLPCLFDTPPEIEMRGADLDDGFRSTR